MVGRESTYPGGVWPVYASRVVYGQSMPHGWIMAERGLPKGHSLRNNGQKEASLRAILGRNRLKRRARTLGVYILVIPVIPGY